MKAPGKLETAWRIIQIIPWIPMALLVIWDGMAEEEKKRRYELGEI